MQTSELITDSIIYIVLGCILVALFSGLMFLLKKQKPDSTKTVKALTVRIVLSIALFFFLIIAFMEGWIKPHGLLKPQVSSQPINENK